MPRVANAGVEYKCVAQRLAANKGGREEENRREISVALYKRQLDKLRNTKPLIARVATRKNLSDVQAT
jgi:hypothetical protein